MNRFLRLPEAALAALFVGLLACLACVDPVHAAPGGEGGNTECGGQGNPNSPCEGDGSGGPGGNGGHGTGVAKAQAQAGAESDATATAEGGKAELNFGGDRYSYKEAAQAVSQVLDTCTEGVAGSAPGFTASVAKRADVCDAARLIQLHVALGEGEAAKALLRDTTWRHNGGYHLGEKVPVGIRFRRFMRHKIVEPAFGWLPVVGDLI